MDFKIYNVEFIYENVDGAEEVKQVRLRYDSRDRNSGNSVNGTLEMPFEEYEDNSASLKSLAVKIKESLLAKLSE